MGLQLLESGSYFSPLSSTVLCSSVPPIANRKPSENKDKIQNNITITVSATVCHQLEALTCSHQPMAQAGGAHGLQIYPGLSVGVVEGTHAAGHSGWFPGPERTHHSNRNYVI